MDRFYHMVTFAISYIHSCYQLQGCQSVISNVAIWVTRRYVIVVLTALWSKRYENPTDIDINVNVVYIR